jgi:hypothetical protein
MPLVGGVNVRTNKEGLTALKEAGTELKNSLANRGMSTILVPALTPTFLCKVDTNVMSWARGAWAVVDISGPIAPFLWFGMGDIGCALDLPRAWAKRPWFAAIEG